MEEKQYHDLHQRHKRAEREIGHLKQKLEFKSQEMTQQLTKMKLNEEETTQAKEELCDLRPATAATTTPGPISATVLADWNDLKAKCSLLEQQNQKFRRLYEVGKHSDVMFIYYIFVLLHRTTLYHLTSTSSPSSCLSWLTLRECRHRPHPGPWPWTQPCKLSSYWGSALTSSLGAML